MVKALAPKNRFNPASAGPFLGLFIIFALLSCLKYFALNSSYFDMGIFLKYFDSLSRGDYSALFVLHMQPLMLVYQKAAFLVPAWEYGMLVLQSLLVALPALMLTSDVFYRGVPQPAYVKRAAVAAYCLYVPVWYNALFDFHLDHLGIPILFGFYYLCRSGKWLGAFGAGVLLALVKEPFALQTVFCGIYLAVRYRKFFCGALLGLFGAAYFWGCLNFFIAYFSSGSRGVIELGAFSYMGGSIPEMLAYVFTHPFSILGEIVTTPSKGLFIFIVLGALGFVPLLGVAELIPALPFLGISLLARFGNYYDYSNHYTAGLVAPVMMAFIAGLPAAKKLWDRLGLRPHYLTGLIGAALILFHVMFSPSPASRFFWTNKLRQYGYSAYIAGDRDRVIKRALERHIPPDHDVYVTTTNMLNYRHLAQRDAYFGFPYAVEAPFLLADFSAKSVSGLLDFIRTGRLNETTRELYADYVVVDLKRPLYVYDRGCDWVYGQCGDEAVVAEFYEHLGRMQISFTPVFEYDGFSVWKRREEG